MKTLILIMIALSLTGCTEPVAVEKVKRPICEFKFGHLCLINNPIPYMKIDIITVISTNITDIWIYI